MIDEGMPVATSSPKMISLFRYTALLVGLLAVAIVLGVCGEGACATCAHEWLRADRPERPLGMFAASLVTAIARPVVFLVVATCEAWQAPPVALSPTVQLAPLRI